MRPIGGVTRFAAVLLLSTPAAWSASVHVIVASESPYGVYTASPDATDLDLIGITPRTPDAPGGTLVHEYQFDMDDERSVFIAVWDEPDHCAPLLVELTVNGLPVYSGDPAWQVYPRGIRGRVFDTPTTAAIAQQIRQGSRLDAWQKAAVVEGNGADPARAIDAISPEAAWMSLTAVPEAAAGNDLHCALYRIIPNELWPEIQLWHGRNAGRAANIGTNWVQSAPPRFYMGGGGGSSGTAGIRPLGTSFVRATPSPFLDNFPVPNASSTSADVPPETPSDPIVPPPDDTERDQPPDDPRRSVPEPTTALTLLMGLLLRRPRRG
jgi:hypothetical protein